MPFLIWYNIKQCFDKEMEGPMYLLKENPMQLSKYVKQGYLVLYLVIVTTMLVGCGNRTTEEEARDAESNEIIKQQVDMEQQEEDNTLPMVTKVVYNFDEYEEVIPARTDSFYKRDAVKGVYVSGHVAGIESWMDELIDLADTTEINAFVIDVKNDSGRICFDTDIEEVDAIGSDSNYIRDIDGLMDRLYEHDIYPIARIVTFKDPYLAAAKPEYAIKNADGSLWKYKGIPWLNPYNKDTWKYVVEVAKEAARVGFKEIQFDYIRFEATSSLKSADFGGLDQEHTRMEVILEFIDYALEELEPYDVELSADVFGIVINSELDSKVIGQNYIEMAKRLDVICPMVYPSHYGYGFYGIPAGKHSDLYPYKIINGSMEDSNEVLEQIPEGEHRAVVRPWLQAFTATYLGAGNYMTYGKEAIRDQINGAYDAGLEEWILWHAGVKYNSDALLPKE